VSGMQWGVLGGPDRLQPGLMAVRTGNGVPWRGRRRIIAGLGARLFGRRLVREAEEFLARQP
jgi:hypothetical protein